MSVAGAIFKVAAIFLCAVAVQGQPFTQGVLRAQRAGRVLGDCPLKRTTVNAAISGMVARVRVTQDFTNSLDETIEAVYALPLPHDAAVDEMTMLVGNRSIRAKIKTREDARALYETARDSGRTAALLEQERPNIFTQSVANVLPRDRIRISLAYTQTLKYEDGSFEFAFPMTVGPRYSPTTVRDASRITPPVAAEGVRAGHDITIEVSLDAGVPLAGIQSSSHDIDVQRISANRAIVKLRDESTIPNKDFLLRYDSAGDTMQDVFLAHRSQKGGYFALMLQPPRRTGVPDVGPKELIFVLDTSGSMQGFPIEKAKEAMKLALDGLYPQDTFNIITFSGHTEILYAAPVPATDANLRIARMFLESRAGGGGTEMMQAIHAALAPSGEAGRTRIVCFMTDGFVGNDQEILAEIQKYPASRVFAFGIGSSVNRFLLDGMALYGRGEADYVGLRDDGSAAARRFHQRVREPLMTDISIDWGGLNVTDVHPRRIPDLFSAKPVIVTGRYAGHVRGAVRLRGKVGGFPSERNLAVDLPAAQPEHDAVAALWARQKVRDLMSEDYTGAHRGELRPDLRQQITRLGLDHQLVTAFTSFVAVEERVVTSGRATLRIEVPVEIPEGVSHRSAAPQRIRVGGNVQGVPGGVAGGTQGGVLGGILGSVPSAAPPPPPPSPKQFSTGALVAPMAVPSAAVVIAESNAARQKLDPDLRKLLDAPDPATGVLVQVLVKDASPATLRALRQLGFELQQPPRTDLQLVGRIAVSRLLDLAAAPFVRFVVPIRPR
jgi:Ca-activated chloride channel family protein